MQREIVIVAGANGVGKTTFARAFLREYDYEFLNPDEIAKSLSVENPAENHRLVLPNIYSRGGRIIYEMPDGTIVVRKPRKNNLKKYPVLGNRLVTICIAFM